MREERKKEKKEREEEKDISLALKHYFLFNVAHSPFFTSSKIVFVTFFFFSLSPFLSFSLFFILYHYFFFLFEAKMH